MSRPFYRLIHLRIATRFWKEFFLGLVLVFASIAPVAAFGGTTASTIVTSGRIHPVRTPNGNVARNLRQQVESQNWSGYVVAKYETGQSYTAATAIWVVPSVTASPGPSPGYSSSWVGIGGFLLNSRGNHIDKTLIQLGTEQDVSSNGATAYSAWYETLPNPEQVITGFAVNPGDTIEATLADGPAVTYGKFETHSNAKGSGGSGQPWTLTMKDETTGQSWSTTLTYKSSLASAEWIEEAPSSSGGILPLANFGTVTFDPGTANGGNPGLTQSNAVIMYDPNGQTSNVSVPDRDTDGFNAAWGNGTTLTAVSPPAS